jgi:hypothetical protein
LELGLGLGFGFGFGFGFGLGVRDRALLLLGVEVHRRADGHPLLGEQQQQQQLVRVRSMVRGRVLVWG